MPLPQGTHPRLDVNDITNYFEKMFGDVLYLYASTGCTCTDDLSHYTSHGLLTFGTVIERQGGTVAHFTSTPSPKWYFENNNHITMTSYSTQVPSRVDFQVHNVSNVGIHLFFWLCLPPKERNQFRTAYLSQHPSDADAHTRLIDDIGFSLIGNFSHSPTPAYLFVPPLHGQYVNGMYCIRHPLPDSLFYWASDPEGKEVIPEGDWERYSIPMLRVRTWIGSHWYRDEYDTVQKHLIQRNYGSDGKGYARDKGYPELILGDPHEGRMTELEVSDEDEPFRSGSHLTSPSMFSLVNAPNNIEGQSGEGLSVTARLAKQLGLRNNTNNDTASQPKDNPRVVSLENETDDPDGWDLIES
ncbi:hypothetical protein PQX77_009049 [Marasmius sp. AFHP31]|nr:hypothetical protein PQX77_009049 [Marasmius sp. AFHP31]